MLYSNKFSMTYRSVAWKTVATQDFFVFSGPAPFSATTPVIGTGLAMSLLTATAALGFLRPAPVVAVDEVVAQLFAMAVSAPAF
jgi:hypothetical protein